MNEYTIKVSDLFTQGPLPNGTWIIFTIDNCYLDADRKMTLDSWELITYTYDGYLIDRVSNGLSLSFPCNAPCQSCLADNPNYCLTCNALTGSTILYSNRCYAKCPDRLYVDEYNKC
jgi:hypothetical protein